MDWIITPCISFIHKQVKVSIVLLNFHTRVFCLQELVATSDSNLTRSFMYLFQMLMEDICEDESASKDKNMRSWIVSVFLFSVIWSLGATGDALSQEKFDIFFKNLVGGKDEPIPAVIGKIDCPIPPEGTVYDYMFEAKGRGKWTPWLDIVKDQSIDPNIKKLSDIIVPTIYTARSVHNIVVYDLLHLLYKGVPF